MSSTNPEISSTGPFAAGDQSWYALAGSEDIPHDFILPVTLFGQRLIIWRDSEGRARLWRDYCPHRGTRLSLGFIRNGELVCRYHGLRFNENGNCVAIPAIPELIPSANIRTCTFEARERYGIVWGTLNSAPPEPELRELDAMGRNIRFCRSFHCHAPASVVADEATKYEFAPFEGGGNDESLPMTSAPSESVSTIVYTDKTEKAKLAVCIQPVNLQRCVAHVMAFWPRRKADLMEMKLHFSRQFKRIRTRAEGRSSTVPT